MRDITHFLLATLLSLATLACRHDTPPADGSLSRQLPPDTKEILRQLNDRDNREEALRLADSLAALPPSDDPWLEIRIAQAVANTLYKFRRDPSDAIRVQERALAVYRLHPDAADDPADLLSTLGHYYRRKGMREKEVEVIQEAMDWCVAHPEKLNRGFVYTFADLSSTYSDLGLYDKAMEAISRSIDYSLQLDSFTISDLYRMKAGIFWELEQHDSTLYYARQALKRGEKSCRAPKALKGSNPFLSAMIKATSGFGCSLFLVFAGAAAIQNRIPCAGYSAPRTVSGFAFPFIFSRRGNFVDIFGLL